MATTDLEDDVLTSGQKKYIEVICFKEDLSGAQKDKNSDKGKKTIAKYINLDFALHLNHQIEVQKLTFMVNFPSIRLTASLSTMGGGGACVLEDNKNPDIFYYDPF